MKDRAASLAARTPHVRGVVNREVVVAFDRRRTSARCLSGAPDVDFETCARDEEEQSRRISARAIASRERRRRRASIETPVDGASEDAASWSYCQPALGDNFRRRDRWPCLGRWCSRLAWVRGERARDTGLVCRRRGGMPRGRALPVSRCADVARVAGDPLVLSHRERVRPGGPDLEAAAHSHSPSGRHRPQAAKSDYSACSMAARAAATRAIGTR